VKTISLKKVAVVAVASLGFGLLSVVPANAAGTDAAITAASVGYISLASATSSPAAGAAVTVNMGTETTSTAANGSGNTTHAKFTGLLTDYPANGMVQVTAVVTATGTTTVMTNGNNAISGGTLTVTSSANTAFGGNNVAASATLGNASFTFTPKVAGTYVLKVWHDADDGSDLDLGESVQTISIVVAAASGVSAGTSTAYQGDAVTYDTSAYNGTATTTGTIAAYQPTLCSKTTGTQCANVLVTVRNAAGNAISNTTAYTYAAEISGAGNLGITDTDATITQAASARAVSLTTPANNIFNVSVWPDGTAGKGTVTITVTDPDGVKTTIATRSVTFYGTVAKLEVAASSQNYSVLRAGGYTAGITTGLTSTSDVPALSIKATDSNGTLVPGLTITGTPTDTAIIASATAVAGGVANDAGYLFGGLGYYHSAVTSAAAAASSKTASTVTYSTTLSTGAKISTTASFTVGGSVATEVLSFDKTSYAPGECMVVTITAKDSAGNPVYDGKASPAVTFSKSIGGTLAAGTYAAGVKSSSSSTVKCTIFAPALGGAFTAQATSSATGTPTITASSSVTDANAGLLTQIDALNAKIVALNALIAKIMKKLGVK